MIWSIDEWEAKLIEYGYSEDVAKELAPVFQNEQINAHRALFKPIVPQSLQEEPKSFQYHGYVWLAHGRVL